MYEHPKNLFDDFDSKLLVHSEPFRFVKSSDQTIIWIIRKNKSILMFLNNPNNCFTGTYLKPSQH